MSWARGAVGAALLLLCGCSKLNPNSLSATEANKLILEFDRLHCPGTVIYDDRRENAYVMFPDDVSRQTDQVMDWLRVIAERDHLTEMNVKTGFGCVRSSELRSPKDGWKLYFRGCGRPAGQGAAARLTGCVAIPTDLKILDISKDPEDPKRATVTYKAEGTALTSIGILYVQAASASDMGIRLQDLKGTNQSALMHGSEEHQAVMQRLDETGWRVNDTTFFNPAQ